MSGKSKILLLVLVILQTAPLFSQNYRVLYAYSYAMDSLKPDILKHETMVLDADAQGSVFYSYPKYLTDTLRKQGNLRSDKSYSVTEFVIKKHPDFQTGLFSSIGTERFKISDPVMLKWEIKADTDTLQGLRVQKAEASCGGRKWTAWFSPDIPLQDGPYVFYGLPGLIIKLSDTAGQHSYSLLSFKENKEGRNPVLGTLNRNAVAVSPEKFSFYWKEHVKDPAKSIKLLLLNHSKGFSVNYDGKEYSVQDMLKNADEHAQNKLKEENNFQLLTLYR